MRKKFLFTLLILAICGSVYSQTIGLLTHNNAVSEAYTLFTPEQGTGVFLINNCGELINEWKFSEKPALSCYLLENGNILRAGKNSLEIRDWNNNIIWSYSKTNNNLLQHHDIEPLPNGNILCVVSERFTKSEIVELGRDPSITGNVFRVDKIVELQPIGTNDAQIVWEWKFSDHLIQDFDNTKLNYGVVEEHPELIDLNFDNGYDIDWTHVNSVDYNSNLDQIIISVRHLNEIMIIDHSTTNIEVSGHSGGNSGMGGDVVFRWGNPQVYRQGDASNQKLFAQHDAKWIDDNYLDEGKISVFNNGGDGTSTYSSIHIIQPNIIDFEYQKDNNMFLPADYYWSWHGEILGEIVKESKKCSASCLENGNIVFVEYSKCRINEISRTGELLWSYVCPVGEDILSQGDETNILLTGIFKGEKYYPDYPAFTDKDMTPQGIIENENSVSDLCVVTEIIDQENKNEKLLLTNICSVGECISLSRNLSDAKVCIYNYSGILVKKLYQFNGKSLSVNLPAGMYFIQITERNKSSLEKLIII